MANTRVQLLFVLTLLQLCRAEISDKLPEWYSANVINDGYQPKSISEIFSTESPFSSTNPIVVLPKLTSTASTFSPSSSIVDEKTTKTQLQSSTPLPPTLSTITPQLSTEFSSRFPSQPPQVEITQFTEQTNPPHLETQPGLRSTTLSTSSPLSTLSQQTTLEQRSGRFFVPVENESELLTTQQSTTPRPLPNYFVIYQQTPQDFPGLTGQGLTIQGGLFGTGPHQSSSTGLTGQGLPLQGELFETGPQQGSSTGLSGQGLSLQGGLFSTGPQQSSSTGQTGSTVVIQPTTTVSPLTSQLTSSSSFLTSPSQGPTSPRPTRVPTLGGPARQPTTHLIQQTRNCLNITPNIGGPPLKIRVVAPKGSITHLNINPPVPTTTTKRPTTTRTRKTPKPKKNTYEACLNGCKVRREPVCAIPLSATWIDPEQLKGFPSVCHMACFNSYKKEPYEKLLDGRCGRLRTRIQTFDSKTKLKREELNKAQYFVDGGEQTIVEVSALRHKK